MKIILPFISFIISYQVEKIILGISCSFLPNWPMASHEFKVFFFYRLIHRLLQLTIDVCDLPVSSPCSQAETSSILLCSNESPEAPVPGMQSSVSFLRPCGVRGCRRLGLRDRWSMTEAGIAEKSSTAMLSGIYTCDIAAKLIVADVANNSLKR